MRGEIRTVARWAVGTAVPACLAVVCAAAAAFGVASFPDATNPAGAAASPYPPASDQTLRVNVAFKERPSGATPLPNLRGRGPSEVRVGVPPGWTDAACGGVRRINGGGNTAEDVISWACTLEGPADARVLRWAPQAGNAPLFGTLLAQQEFTFSVRTASPDFDTAYGAAASPAPGFGVTAAYPETIPTEISKAPNAPADAPGTVADGLVRFVAGVHGPPPPPMTQSISAEIPSVLAMTFSQAPVLLAAGDAAEGHHPFSGTLNDVTVTDTRPGGIPWVLSARASDFGGPGDPVPGSAGYLGWVPLLRDGAPAGVTAGPPVAGSLESPAGPGLAEVARLAGSADGHGIGPATTGAALDLRLPTGLPGGTYTTTLTLTLI